MNITKLLMFSLFLVLSACMPAPADSPADPTAAPGAIPTVLQATPTVAPIPMDRDEPDNPDKRGEFEPGITSKVTHFDDVNTVVGEWLPAKQPERVEFAPGTSSIEYDSILPSGLSIKQYVLAAKEGQIMTVNIVSEDVPVSLSVTSPSGIFLYSEILQANGSTSGGNVHNLAETGDYLITLTKADHTPSTHYSLDFMIQ